MARDTLAVLSRLRETAVTEASRALSHARAAEAQAERRLDEHLHEMACEAVGVPPEHMATFADWIVQARRRMATLQAAVQRQQVHVAVLRQALAARRTEAEAVAKARATRAGAVALDVARREQAAMDEAAGRHRNAADFA